MGGRRSSFADRHDNPPRPATDFTIFYVVLTLPTVWVERNLDDLEAVRALNHEGIHVGYSRPRRAHTAGPHLERTNGLSDGDQVRRLVAVHDTHAGLPS